MHLQECRYNISIAREISIVCFLGLGVVDFAAL